MNAWKWRQKQAFPEKKPIFQDHPGMAHLTHTLQEKAQEALVNGDNSSRPWTIHCAFMGHPLPILGPSDEQETAVQFLSPARKTQIEIP